MKKSFLLILMSVFVFNSSIAQKAINYSEKELIVKFNKDVQIDYKNCIFTDKFNNKKVDSLNKAASIKSIKVTGNKKEGRTFVLKFKNELDINQLIEDYSNTGLFEYVEPNYIGKGHGVQFTPNDPLFYNRQWSHYNDGTFPLFNATTDADMDTDLAWDITQGANNIIVAILDSGLKLDHPEFSGRIWENSDEVQDGTDTDGNGFIDDINGGWDFANENNDPSDDHGHGTNVAGIALATGNNNIGYAGINWNSKIMVCKVIESDGTGFYSWWADAIYYAVDNGANVINMSLGGNNASSLLEDAINYAYNNNVYAIVSSGNQNSVIQYPAKYENALAIGATNSDDTRSNPFFWDPTSGSNFGPELDFIAPGNFIYGPNHLSNTDYSWYWGGTSQAAPQVTGIISLILSLNPSLTVSEIRTILEESSEDQVGDSEDTSGWDQYYGYGRVNAFNALTHNILGVSQNNSEALNVTIYPNPATNFLSISNLTEGNYQIKIHDLLGKNHFNQNFTNQSNQININLPKLSSGTYFISITEENFNNSVSKKIVIQ